jgi:hypothetical protein
MPNKRTFTDIASNQEFGSDFIATLNDRLRRLADGAGVTQTTVQKITQIGGGGASDVKIEYDSGVPYTDSQTRTAGWKAGDYPSVLDFGAAGDGVANDTVAFQDGLDSVSAAGGGDLFVPKGDYLIDQLDIPAGVRLRGEGRESRLVRNGDVAAGLGLLDVTGENSGLFDLQIDGDVDTSVGLLYSDFSADPMHATLTENTSVWVHGGAHGFRMAGVVFFHTGGYSALFDARDADLRDVLVDGCTVENCRPHLFGASGGDKTYGSWTGGFHYQCDGRASAGKLYSVKGLTVTRCVFRRLTGVGVWGHCYGFDEMHRNVNISHNRLEDIGFHGLQLGSVNGGSVSNNVLRRIGYTTSDDTSASTPKYLALAYASAIDMSGLVLHASITGNVVVSANGDCFDLDGLAYSTVSGNTCVIPSSGEPAYTEDSISAIGPGGAGNNWTYGMQTGNTNLLQGGEKVNIIGNSFRNMGGGAIRLYTARGCLVAGNNIEHPAAPNVAPITLGNTGTADTQRARDNVVRDNFISYDPAGSALPAIVEDATIADFDADDENLVGQNVLVGNCYEFLRHATSASKTALHFTTNDATAAARSEFFLQREGYGITAACKGYTRNGATSKQRFQFADYRDGATEDAVLNVSLDGAAGTGVIATADRAVFGAGDLVATGKLLSYGFLAQLGMTATGEAYADADADLLDADWGLLRFNQTLGRFEQSVTTLAGARVWIDLVPPTGAAAGSDREVQFNDGGTFGAASTFVYNSGGALQVGSATDDGSGATVQVTGFVRATTGFSTPGTATDAIQAAAGGVTARWLIATRSLSLTAETEANAGLSDVGQGRMYFDSSTNRFRVSENGAAYVDVLSGGGGGIPAGADRQVQFNSSGVFGAASTFVYNSGGALQVGSSSDDGTGAKLQVTGFVNATTGYATASSSSEAFKALAGGGKALGWIGERTDGDSAFTLSRPSYREWGLNIGSSGQFIVRDRTAAQNNLECNPSRVWTLRNQLVVAGSAGGQSILVQDGYVQSDEGFYTADAGHQAIQTPSGGVYARSLRATTYMQVGQSSGAPSVTGADSLVDGALYYDTATSKLRARVAGTFVDVTTGGGTPAGSNRQVQFNSSGVFGASSTFVYNSGGALQVGSSSDDGTGAKLQVTGFVNATTGYATASSSSEAFKALAGGGKALGWIGERTDGDSAFTLSRPSYREWGLNIGSSGEFIVRDRSGALNNLECSTGRVWTLRNQLVVTGSAGGQSIWIQDGYLQSDEGMYTPHTSYQAIQAPSGGVYARSVRASTYMQAGQNFGAPSATSGDTIGNGAIYYDTSTSKLRAYVGGVFTDIVTGSGGGGGVTSLNALAGALNITAGTGVTVSPSGSSIQVSIGQAVSTVSAVTFASVATGSGGAFNSGASGASIAFQTSNYNLQMDGNGNISAAGQVNLTGFASAYKIGGTTVIDASRNTDFARLKFTGQLFAPVIDDNYWTPGGSTTAKIYVYDIYGSGIGWIPIYP